MEKDNKDYIQNVGKWLSENGYLFKKSSHDDTEVVFSIYEDAIHQSALLIEMALHENNECELFCCVAPYIPQGNIKQINLELEKLNFINAPFAKFGIMDGGIVAINEFNIPNPEDSIFTVCFNIEMFKESVDNAIPGIHYSVWRGSDFSAK